MFLMKASGEVEEEYKSNFEVLDVRLGYDNIDVHLSEEYPLWISPRQVPIDELMYLLDADCLYLAEQTFYSSCINGYQRILKQFVASHDAETSPRDGPKGFSARLRWMSAKPQRRQRLLSSGELRHILIRDKLTITQIAQRSECFNSSQNRYLKACKDLYSLEQGFELYLDVEDTLKYVVHDQEQKSKEETEATIGVTLAIFAALTVLSVMADLAGFFKLDPLIADPFPWQRGAVIVAVLTLLLYSIRRAWSRRRRVD
jgi:hypothetical protein